MSTELSTHVHQATLATHAFEPSDRDAALSFAEHAVASGLMPRSLSRASAVLLVVMKGRELGLTAMQSIGSLHIIEGKPTMSADLMMALCLREKSVCKSFRLITSTATIATYEACRVGEEPIRMSFTIEQAKTAGLLGKDNWKKYPEAMLRARCIAIIARAVFPDLMLGVYDPDEMAPVAQVTSLRNVANVVDVEPEAFVPISDETSETATIVQATIAAFGVADSVEALSTMRAQFSAQKLTITGDMRERLRSAYEAAKARLTVAA